MQSQQPGGSLLAGRRADAGTVKLTDRDITGLMLCTDDYGAPTTCLRPGRSVMSPALEHLGRARLSARDCNFNGVTPETEGDTSD